jgi:hypothetical protein
MSGGQTVASGTAASGLCVSNLNGSLLSVQYRTNRQVTPFWLLPIGRTHGIHRQKPRRRESYPAYASVGWVLNKYLKSDLLIINDTGLKVLPPKSGEILSKIL